MTSKLQAHRRSRLLDILETGLGAGRWRTLACKALEQCWNPDLSPQTRAEEVGSRFADYMIKFYVQRILDQLKSPTPFKLSSVHIKALVDLGTDRYLWNYMAKTTCATNFYIDSEGQRPIFKAMPYDPATMELVGYLRHAEKKGSVKVESVGMGLHTLVGFNAGNTCEVKIPGALRIVKLLRQASIAVPLDGHSAQTSPALPLCFAHEPSSALR